MPAGMRTTRARTSIPVEFETDALRGIGKIKNVGLGGLFVGSTQIPEQGESVSLSFHFPGGQELSVHGWIYGLKDGLIRDLRTSASSQAEAGEAYKTAIGQL